MDEKQKTERPKKNIVVRYWWIGLTILVLLGSGFAYGQYCDQNSNKVKDEKKEGTTSTIGISDGDKVECPKTINYSADGTISAQYQDYSKNITADAVTDIHNQCPEVTINATSPEVTTNSDTSQTDSTTKKTTTQDSASQSNTSSSGASGSDDPTKSKNTITYSSLQMITPYIHEEDIERVPEAFSTSADVPWGFIHNGIDFVPKANLTEFRAVTDGVVSFSIFHNDNGGKWQVSMAIDHSPWSINYAWEPFTYSEADAQTQLGYFSVQNGATVHAGDILGKLLVVDSNGAHVHFGVNMPGGSVCPQQYFTTDAYNSIMNLIHAGNPTMNMCY